VGLGLRAGWLLIALEAVSLAGLIVLGSAYLEGEGATLVFAALVAWVAIWVAQAVDAHRRAVRAGARPAGLLLVAVAPVVILLFSGFWLVCGRGASPTSALEAYASAWRGGAPARAVPVLATPRIPTAIQAEWDRDEARLAARLAALAAEHGPESGLDPADPFRNVSFTVEPPAAGARTTAARVDIVRQTVARSTFLGFLPTASQQTVAVEPLGTLPLVLVDGPPGILGLRDRVWRVGASTLQAGR
jgi:hypothetical protein